MNEIVGFDELLWLRELSYERRKRQIPELIGVKLLTRGLVERTTGGFMLTARGQIALAKLG
jgi:hypothetical protein